MRQPPRPRAEFESGQVEIADPDFAGHQLVQQRLEKLVEDRALPSVQVDLAVDAVEDGDDFALFIQSWRHGD